MLPITTENSFHLSLSLGKNGNALIYIFSAKCTHVNPGNPVTSTLYLDTRKKLVDASTFVFYPECSFKLQTQS